MFWPFTRKPDPTEALARTMRPRPEYRERRLAQFSPERRQRYLENIVKAGL